MRHTQDRVAHELRDARAEANRVYTKLLESLNRFQRELIRNQEEFCQPRQSDTVAPRPQTRILNEGINHIENFLRNLDLRDWANAQAKLAVAQANVDRVLAEREDDGGIDFAV